VARLRGQQHCDVIVLLAHSGLERDTAAVAAAAAAGTEYHGPAPDENWGYRLLTQVPGADVVILGHTHTGVSFVRGEQVCAQAGRNGDMLGRIELTLTRNAAGERWHIARRTSALTNVSAATPEAPTLAR